MNSFAQPYITTDTETSGQWKQIHKLFSTKLENVKNVKEKALTQTVYLFILIYDNSAFCEMVRGHILFCSYTLLFKKAVAQKSHISMMNMLMMNTINAIKTKIAYYETHEIILIKEILIVNFLFYLYQKKKKKFWMHFLKVHMWIYGFEWVKCKNLPFWKSVST